MDISPNSRPPRGDLAAEDFQGHFLKLSWPSWRFSPFFAPSHSRLELETCCKARELGQCLSWDIVEIFLFFPPNFEQKIPLGAISLGEVLPG